MLRYPADKPDAARDRATLYVSINTVNTHIRNIYSKLGARDRSSAVQQARELRLLATGRARIIAEVSAAPARAQSPDSGVDRSLGQAAGSSRGHTARLPVHDPDKGAARSYRSVRLPDDGV